MKLEIVNRGIDRQLLTAMVVSTRYLRETVEIYSSSFFSATYMQIVAKWCFDYFEKYEAAPGRHIQDIYDSAVRKETEDMIRPEELDLVQKFLLSISSEYDASVDLNIDYLLDETIKWWRKQDLKGLLREVDEALRTTSDTEEAEKLIRQHKSIEKVELSGFDVFEDKTKVKSLFETKPTPLITFGGRLGDIVNPWMTRDQLIGILAPPKGGKTAALVESVIRGIGSRCNVALFEAGDLSEQQTLARVYANLTGKCTDNRYVGPHYVSVLDCWHNQLGSCMKRCRLWHGAIRGSHEEPLPPDTPPDYVPCTVCQGTQDFLPCVGCSTYHCDAPYTEDEVMRVQTRMFHYMGNRRFRCDVRANMTLSVGGIDNILKQWAEKKGFIPDVIVIDYADILAAEDEVKHGSERDKHNIRWMRLRRLSQEWHALVLVATQTDAGGFGKENLNFSNFSEDMRKYAHATGILAEHQTEYEKKIGVCRMSWILGREGQPDRMTQAVVLHNHYIGRFHIDSFARDKSYRPQYDDEGDKNEQSQH